MRRVTAIDLRVSAFLTAFLLTAAGCLLPALAAEPAQPASAASPSAGTPGVTELPYQLWPLEVISSNGVVVSGSKQASQAGAAILEAGGNAVDAAVATAFALGVTEPMTSGLGSETFILIHSADGETHAIDGSCYVPRLASPDEFQKVRATAERGYVQGYKAIAVPGSLAALTYALHRYGSTSLAEVLAPAIDLADFGYHLNASTHGELTYLSFLVRHQEYVADLFLKNFTDTWGPNHLFCASDLANTLRRIAKHGPQDFYGGHIADEIDADMQRHGGYVRKADLMRVRAVERPPIRASYRGLEVITFPFPGGGGSLVEMLHILENFPSQFLRDDSLDRLHLLIEAARITWADDQTSKVPLVILDRWLTDRGRAALRAKLIRFDRALLPSEISGAPPERHIAEGTTQVSVVDRWGNAVALSQTVGGFFGATVATPGLGFLYNANLNAFDTTNPSSPHYLRPGQVPMTTLAPTIILKDGKPLLVLGGAGSDRVVPTIALVISGFADRGMDPCAAVASPREMWGTNWGDPRAFVELAGENTPEKVDALEKQGFQNIFKLAFPASWMDLEAFGGTNVVFIDPRTGLLHGVPDPRRSGFAAAPAAH